MSCQIYLNRNLRGIGGNNTMHLTNNKALIAALQDLKARHPEISESIQNLYVVMEGVEVRSEDEEQALAWYLSLESMVAFIKGLKKEKTLVDFVEIAKDVEVILFGSRNPNGLNRPFTIYPN